MVKASELAQVGYKYIGRPYSEMDCQKFVERCLKDCGNNTDLPGSNAWFRKMTWTGSPEECAAKFGSVPAGAFLFILEHDGGEPEKYKPDGIGNASHIGLTTGSGKGAIHSSSSRGQVCESEFKGKTIKHGGWNRIGLWDQVDYGEKINRILNGGGSGGKDEPMGGKATVWAPSGSTVNLRKSKSTTSDRIEKVPIGDKVDLIEYGDDWCKVSWNGKTGYMMRDFLVIGDVTPSEDDPADPDVIMVNRTILEDIYAQIGDVLGIRG